MISYCCSYCNQVVYHTLTNSTSTILVPTGTQDTRVQLTQFFLDFRGSTNFGIQSDLSTSRKSLRAANWSCSIFVLIAHHMKKNDDSPFTSVVFLCFWRYISFNPMFFCAAAVEVLLEIRKYYFWCNVLTYDIWRVIHL